MKKNEKIFLATRKLTGPYKFIIQSTKIHSEKLLDQKLVLKDRLRKEMAK